MQHALAPFSLIRIILPGIAFGLALTTILKSVLPGLGGLILSPASDFALAVYYPVRAFLDGANPYDASSYLAHYPVQNAFAPYLPSTLLLHLPFGLVPLGIAASLYLVFEICFILVLAVVCLRWSGLKASTPAVLLIATVVVLSRPGRFLMLFGQVTLEVVLATYVALHYAHSAPRLGGLGLALTSFKPNFGLPLALLLLLRGNRRLLGYGVFFVLLLNLPVCAILAYRAGGVHAFAEQLSTTFSGFQAMGAVNSPVSSPLRIDAVALVGRFVGHPPDFAGQVVVALAVLGLAAIAIRRMPKSLSDQQSFVLSAGLIGTAVLLCCYHQYYDLLLLTLPFVGVACRRFHPMLDPPAVRWSRLVLLTFLAFNYIVSGRVLLRLNLLEYDEPGSVSLVRDPLGLVLGSLNGLALLALFCSFVATALARPALMSPSVSSEASAEPTR